MTNLTPEIEEAIDRAVLHLRPTSAGPLSNAQKQASKKYLIEKLGKYLSPTPTITFQEIDGVPGMKIDMHDEPTKTKGYIIKKLDRELCRPLQSKELQIMEQIILKQNEILDKLNSLDI